MVTQTISSRFDALRGAMAGSVSEPGDADYDKARSLFNGDIDRKPAAVALVSTPADVAAALAFAQAEGLEVTVRGGGHSTAGQSSRDDALMINLSALDTVTVDAQARTARAGGGATLASLDAATQEVGLAVTAGAISHTGIGGLTLGGGMGWLTRKAGLTIDNLVSAEVVLADGSVVRASADEHPDLFWALRGGGGNFGVVTEFTYRLHEVGPLVHLDMSFYGLDQIADVLAVARQLLAELPNDHTVVIAGLNAPPAPFVPEEFRFRPGIALMLVGFGSPQAHAAAVERIRALITGLFTFTTPIPYAALQQMLDEGAQWGSPTYEKGSYLAELSDDAIAVIADHLPRKSSPLSQLLIYPLSGAYAEVADDATAFGGSRSARFALFMVGIGMEPGQLEVERPWVRSFWSDLQPFAHGGGAYINSESDFGDDRVRATYGAKYERLAAIKAQYDPTNVFTGNANIKPA